MPSKKNLGTVSKTLWWITSLPTAKGTWPQISRALRLRDPIIAHTRPISNSGNLPALVNIWHCNPQRAVLIGYINTVICNHKDQNGLCS